METINHIISAYWIIVSVSFILIALGIAVPQYQWYWLIAGLNGLTAEELKKYDLRSIENFFGKVMIAIGVLIFFNVIAWVALGSEFLIFPFFVGIVLIGVLVFVIYGAKTKSNAKN